MPVRVPRGAPPFALPASVSSALSLVYLAGSLAAQRSGALTERIGTTRALIAGSAAMVVGLRRVGSGTRFNASRLWLVRYGAPSI